MPESEQHKLDRVRKPRVHITYDVEIGDAIQMKEIPFVVGVMGDYSGKPDPDDPLPPLKEREFKEIDRDNFDVILEGIKPRLAFKVDNKLADDNTQLAVELRFKSIDDFHPERVANQISPIRQLVEARQRLSDLLTKLDGNDKLNDLLQKVISNTESLEKLGQEAGVKKAEDEGKKK